MTYQFNQRELVINLETGDYQLRPILHRINGIHIIGPVDYGWGKFSQAVTETARPDPLMLTWGNGPLAGSRIPGTRRLVFTGYSPHWQGFYISSMGGAAYTMHRLGVDFVTVEGAAQEDSVLILNHHDGQISVRLEEIHPDPLWAGYADPDGEPLQGFYALQQAVLDRYIGEYDPDWVRVFAVGPAARNTNMGIIGSSPVKKGRITQIDEWAGRGGLGSRLLQQHHLAACIFGGDWEDPDLKDSKEIDGYFMQYYGQSMIKVDLGATEKYRYAPGFQTGGTFGVNMQTAGDGLFSFNYASVLQPDQARTDQHSHFILDHYLKQFNEEIIKPRNFAHCGEPCSVACKKWSGPYKKDYEPYEALGPQCGVFDQRAAEELNHFVDALGIDAIQMGGMLAWLLECIQAGLVPPEDFGLPPVDELRFIFQQEASQFDVVEDSARNARYAQRAGTMMLFEPAGEVFRSGLRSAAHALDERYAANGAIANRAVYTSHGESGEMVPNQYWTPGMFSPMPMMGKYFVYYGNDYLPPRTLGRKCVERMVYELYSENSGTCRFHRKWVEAIIDEIITAHYKVDMDYKAHQFEVAHKIFESMFPAVRFWESERTVDIIASFIDKWERFGLKDDSLHEWAAHFRQDKWSAARAYWEEIKAGIEEAFAAGPEAIPENVPPNRPAAS